MMIQTFDALFEIAQSAKINRLDKASYMKDRMLARHHGAPTLKGLLVKFTIMRRIRSIFHRKTDKDYLFALAYSDALLADFQTHTEEYQQSYELLSDEWSQQLFINLLAGEMLMDRRYGSTFQQPIQYYAKHYCVDLPGGVDRDEPFIQEGEILVDCGAFTGDTLREFIDENKIPMKYIGFEPDPGNFQKAQKTLSDSGVIGVVHNAGVSKSSGILHFSPRGDAGRIAEDGEISINVLSMDDAINEPISLIKMDIEGSEYEALEGCASLIRTYKPKLAICVYHKPTDFRKIPLLVKHLNVDYKQFYIRYLRDKYEGQWGFMETVLFVR